MRVTTKGSIFEIDEALQRYRRFPREERPREHPEWGSDKAGALQDFVWHDIDPEGWYINELSGRLIIHTRGTFVSAPYAEITSLGN